MTAKQPQPKPDPSRTDGKPENPRRTDLDQPDPGGKRGGGDMTALRDLKLKPLWIRHTNHYGFREGHFAEIIGVVMAEPSYGRSARPCYRVRFSDGFQDLWPIYDPDEQYEFDDDPFSSVVAK